jgi:hypothetical protein
MRRFVLGWKMSGLERSLGSRIVTYADDLVILCRNLVPEGRSRRGLATAAEIMGKLRLTERPAAQLGAAVEEPDEPRVFGHPISASHAPRRR